MQEKTDSILSTRGLGFSYGNGKPALSDVTLDIPKGKKTVFLGPNGSGKSTLFLHFNGVNRPDSGEVVFEGKAVKYDAASLAALRSAVSVVFQNPDDQIFSATVEEDVAFGPLNAGLPNEEIEKRVEEALRMVGLEEFGERPTQQLSFGQRKRVSIAGALAMRPSLLVMDEPTAGLDPQMVHELLEMADEFNSRGTTVVISTHDVETAYEWADEVRGLHQGRLVFSGQPEEFFDREDRLLHEMGLTPPTVLSLNRSLHQLKGTSLTPYPRTLSEAVHKAFPEKKHKAGRLIVKCVDERMEGGAASGGPGLPRTPHNRSGIYGSLARRLAQEGKLDVHYRFHALESGLMEAAEGQDFVLYTDTALCSLAEEKAKRLERNAGVKVAIVHEHEEEGTGGPEKEG
ncbi:putative branched-chain amino acid transport ATP-binding protein LivG [uncultured archaeon]|nr:putative branched-chain amino acid transport ATP-binding protein LivG [uncultured archaeon]